MFLPLFLVFACRHVNQKRYTVCLNVTVKVDASEPPAKPYIISFNPLCSADLAKVLLKHKPIQIFGESVERIITNLLKSVSFLIVAA